MHGIILDSEASQLEMLAEEFYAAGNFAGYFPAVADLVPRSHHFPLGIRIRFMYGTDAAAGLVKVPQGCREKGIDVELEGHAYTAFNPTSIDRTSPALCQPWLAKEP